MRMILIYLLCLSIAIFGYIGFGNSNNLEVLNQNKEPYYELPVSKSFIKTDEIVPGVGIGKVLLNNGFDDSIKSIGPSFFDNEYIFEDGCKQRNVKWSIKYSSVNISLLEAIFSSENKIVQIKVEGINFITSEGISNDMDLAEFKNTYQDISNLEVYVDEGLKSNSKFVEGYSVFFVNKIQGIAFEFYKNRTEQKWKIASITVFPSGVEFVRGYYCYSVENLYWRKLPTIDIDTITFDNK